MPDYRSPEMVLSATELSRTDLAEFLDVSPATISRWITGSSPMPLTARIACDLHNARAHMALLLETYRNFAQHTSRSAQLTDSIAEVETIHILLDKIIKGEYA